eukprot:ctg_2681.g511
MSRLSSPGMTVSRLSRAIGEHMGRGEFCGADNDPTKRAPASTGDTDRPAPLCERNARDLVSRRCAAGISLPSRSWVCRDTCPHVPEGLAHTVRTRHRLSLTLLHPPHARSSPILSVSLVLLGVALRVGGHYGGWLAAPRGDERVGTAARTSGGSARSRRAIPLQAADSDCGRRTAGGVAGAALVLADDGVVARLDGAGRYGQWRRVGALGQRGAGRGGLDPTAGPPSVARVLCRLGRSQRTDRPADDMGEVCGRPAAAALCGRLQSLPRRSVAHGLHRGPDAGARGAQGVPLWTRLHIGSGCHVSDVLDRPRVSAVVSAFAAADAMDTPAGRPVANDIRRGDGDD